MNSETEANLGVDPDDLDELLQTIEKSYDIQFVSNELAHIRTFGEMTDHIVAKIKLQDKDDCTDQQAFYKLREAIVATRHLDGKLVQANTYLISIFPRQSRLKDFKEVERILGFKLKALRPKDSISAAVLILFLISVVMLFIDWRYGLIGTLVSIALFRIVDKTGKEFKELTVGELTKRMSQRNYVQSRRDKGTVNKKEIESKIGNLLIDELALDLKEIKRETVIL
jgi:ABC-type multidrug transport system fused ATPase/permease subunit